MGRIRVLVVDDHRIFAEALAAALAAEPDVEVGAAGSAPAAERALERAAAEGRAFDVILIDADLGPGNPVPPRRPRPLAEADQRRLAAPPVLPVPRRPPFLAQTAAQRSPVLAGQGATSADGLALLARVCRSHPALRAVVLATEDDPRRAVRALQAGALGWVAKDSSLPRLMAVVRGVLRDETHLPPALLTGVVRELTAARRDRTESERLVETLTPREEEVLRCMVAGLGRQAVAERLYLSPHTVRTHMQNVLGKLGVHSTLAAVAVARRAGVSPSEPPAPSPAPAKPTTPTVASTPGPGAG
ncbi:response regulator transcription factor [Kitasatospora atroaurantiaca]|uniref:LuxR family two component transcriptional regulator n=1 Tax=Kitasatospora atroaurantiaca TaxID=285545 RepID=A0A561EUC9_9ACTN|nr:response regulator transcription factor [Kitasatospora atroaurantiaca]TWE19181.1 LuxR family two component transcriptional regulator [Kitasatospora atroaurantiaca]